VVAANHSSHGRHCPAEYVPRVAFDVISAVMVEDKKKKREREREREREKTVVTTRNKTKSQNNFRNQSAVHSFKKTTKKKTRDFFINKK